MGFLRQNPPNFRGGASTGAQRNRQGNLPNAAPGRMANQAGQQQAAMAKNLRNMDMKTGMARPAVMPQQAQGQPNQMMGAAVMPPQQQQRQDQMQNQMQRLQGQMGGPRPMPQQAQLQGPGSMPQRPQMPQQMGGKGGRAPQPPGRPMQQQQMGGKGGRAPSPPQYGGKGGRSPMPGQFYGR